MSEQRSRRDFLKQATFTGISVVIANKAWAQGNKTANDRINFACIGIDGKGGSDSEDCKNHGNVVAICDVDSDKLDRAANTRFPDAKKFSDWRKMLESMGSGIDAVTVSIPDHMHAVASAAAMQMGHACFTQKPLAHSVWECRRLAEIARSKKVATQMGNQGTAGSSLRKNAALVKKGVLGTVTEVHVWTNRPIWPQGQGLPAPKDPPANLDWKLWLGPAAIRPYGDGYCPFSWRGWWDFGTGALGDMACHTVNLPYMALDLRDPVSVKAVSSGTNHLSYPLWTSITFQFPATAARPALTFTWQDGHIDNNKDMIAEYRSKGLIKDYQVRGDSARNKPSPDLLPGMDYGDSGCLIVGTKGTMYTPDDYGAGAKIYDSSGKESTGVDVGAVTFPESPGHFEEWVRAIKGGEPAMSNFPDYSSHLAETILLGNMAVWSPDKVIEWDHHAMRAKNAPEVAHIVKPELKNGYSI